PPRAMFVFLDSGGPETPSGRSLFSLVFEGATTSMLRLNYDRSDLQSRFVPGNAVLSEALPPGTIVFSSKQGHLTRELSIP
ncbi:MAG: hypothetical protein ABIU54_04360, partial [Candidatus Eisenbacteria bacterium]